MIWKTIFYRSTLISDEERAKKNKERDGKYAPEFEEVDDTDKYWEVNENGENATAENQTTQGESENE